MITVYGFSPSGNCHKVKLLLEQLGHDYRWIETNSAIGETRTPDYLAKNPNGKVPMLEREDGSVLVESNAILCWLADGTPFLPADPWQKAQALSWMFFEQYSHEPAIAVARFIRCFLKKDDDPRLTELKKKGDAALGVMERHLADREFFVGRSLTIADLALFAYTHKAVDGGYDLRAFPAVSAWLARCLRQPGVTEMPTP